MSTATDTRKIGIFGSAIDIRQGEQQTYTDGTPVREGDEVTHRQVSGMLPGCTTAGVAAFCPWGNDGELYVQYGPKRYAHMNGEVTHGLIQCSSWCSKPAGHDTICGK